ncbi:BQ5605_C004g03084 [Microbotryum silenes-dioicae]|uniref:BQ5605_C004g03084 protein n=1 Tax=Microbotryum silenes-dioicae TaxID=796604 RepID=A0A2X0N3R0_9BASI|nr:BQ5605_C004g03084 [Microbotryum silenes-dioicae]
MEGPQGEKVAGILGVRVNPANLAQSLPPSVPALLRQIEYLARRFQLKVKRS